MHLIEFIRASKDAYFKDYIFTPDLSNQNLDHILNSVFPPEYHIPRMVSTRDFMHIKLKALSPYAAILTKNPELIHQAITKKALAIEHLPLLIAQYDENIDIPIIRELLVKWQFSHQDINSINLKRFKSEDPSWNSAPTINQELHQIIDDLDSRK